MTVQLKAEAGKESAARVLDKCGPRRRAGATGTTEEVSQTWMREMLEHEDGATNIARCIIMVFWCMECNCGVVPDSHDPTTQGE